MAVVFLYSQHLDFYQASVVCLPVGRCHSLERSDRNSAFFISRKGAKTKKQKAQSFPHPYFLLILHNPVNRGSFRLCHSLERSDRNSAFFISRKD
jgi:hypothetical protein